MIKDHTEAMREAGNIADEEKEKFRREHSELYMTDEEFEADLQRRVDEVRKNKK